MKMKINENIVQFDEQKILKKWTIIAETLKIKQELYNIFSIYCEYFNIKYSNSNYLPINMKLFSLLNLNNKKFIIDENVNDKFIVKFKPSILDSFNNDDDEIYFIEDNLIKKLANEINLNLKNYNTIIINSFIYEFNLHNDMFDNSEMISLIKFIK